MSRRASQPAIGLSVLTVLFAGRVAGQALVAFLDIPWLPGMDAWFSGLLPYRALLPIQVVILLALVVIDRDAWRGRGLFAAPRPRTGRSLQALACIYALSMVVRYAITRSHLIPIVFHWVLAAYLFTIGRAMCRKSGPGGFRTWPTPGRRFGTNP